MRLRSANVEKLSLKQILNEVLMMVSFPVVPHNEYGWQPPSQVTTPADHSLRPETNEPSRGARWFVGAAVLALLTGCTTAVLVLASHPGQADSLRPAPASTTALQRWWAQAQNDFANLRDASDEVDQVFQQFRPGLLAAACHHVHDAAEVRLKSDLPSPNPHVTAELNAAIEDFHSASHLCLAKIAGSKINYDGEFFSAMAEANRHMQATQNSINRMLTDV